jgi:hypothetical protein
MILDEARMQQTHIRSIQNHNFIENLVIALYFKDYKDEKHKVFQNIEYVWGSISLNDQGHSPCPSGEDPLRQLYAYDGLQYGI